MIISGKTVRDVYVCSFILLMNNVFIFYVVNGTTGEGVSMTVDERKKTAEVWKKATDGKYIYIYT